MTYNYCNGPTQLIIEPNQHSALSPILDKIDKCILNEWVDMEFSLVCRMWDASPIVYLITKYYSVPPTQKQSVSYLM